MLQTSDAVMIILDTRLYTEARRGVYAIGPQITWCYTQNQAYKHMQCTGLSQWEVIPGIVDTQHRLVVGGDTSLRRWALVQGAVLSFAERQEQTMLEVSAQIQIIQQNCAKYLAEGIQANIIRR